jgi:hypothetical protein
LFLDEFAVRPLFSAAISSPWSRGAGLFTAQGAPLAEEASRQFTLAMAPGDRLPATTDEISD